MDVGSYIYKHIIEAFRDAIYEFLAEGYTVELPNGFGYLFIDKYKPSKYRLKFINRRLKYPVYIKGIKLHKTKMMKNLLLKYKEKYG